LLSIKKDGLAVEFTAYKCKMIKEGARTAFTLCHAYRSFALLHYN